MKWIWLPREKYPESIYNFSNTNSVPEEKKKEFGFTVAAFSKAFAFDKKIERAFIKVSADNFFHLFVNGEFTGLGPVLPGGDFLCRRPAPKHYYNEYEVNINGDGIAFFADVRLLPQKVCDYSRNRGGFALEARLVFSDGTEQTVGTDSSWECVRDTAYCGYCAYDSLLPKAEKCFAEEISDIWFAESAPIPMLTFEKVLEREYIVQPGEELSFTAETDRVWGAYPIFEADGECEIKLVTMELEGQQTEEETVKFAAAGRYFSYLMHSVALSKLTVKNTGAKPVTIGYSLLASYYPIEKTGSFVTDDEGFNKIYDVCRHTLKICRQTIHLDSTKHQELLACTGDYYIDALMTLYMFGDLRLAEFDVIRTADWLKANRGRMFHTTYSLIWVQMLYDVYMMTGNISLLEKCREGLEELFACFDSYMGTSGVIEYPPDFMFVDWTVVDGCSMHHPPKALGQTVLNAFYYEALNKAAAVYAFLGETEKVNEFNARAARFKADFEREFFDAEKGLYFDGKADAYGGYTHYAPVNSNKKYFTKYPNILACLYGLCEGEKAKDIIERIIFDETMQDIQPYFMHYMIGAVRKTGLFSEYGMMLLSRWKSVVEECDKGLAEGWIAPEPTYSFDHSHAWGGTVGYQLPSVITGMKILEPGMKKLSFSPCLYGLKFADISFPTRFGEISLKLKEGEEPVITVPNGVEYSVI